MKKVLRKNNLVITISLIVFTAIYCLGCVNSISEADQIEIIYTQPNYSDRKKDVSLSALVNDDQDCKSLLNTLSYMVPEIPGNCGFNEIAIFVYSGDNIKKFYVGRDECQMVCANDPDSSDNHYRIRDEDIEIFRQIIYKYLPDANFMHGLEEWAELKPRNS